MDVITGGAGRGKIHFIGIGGVSMSALAQLLAARGYEVTGSDARESRNTALLTAAGIPVTIGHDPAAVAAADAVVYTDAIRPDDADFKAAVAARRPMLDRGSLLGRVSRGYGHSIAVSGTHGKTTTTGMTAAIFVAAGLDPTVHIGASMEGLCGGLRLGGSEYFITEACEYKRNFLKLHYESCAVLNADMDHLDYFTGMDDIAHAYASFVDGARGGIAAVCGDDATLQALAGGTPRSVTFGLGPDNDYTAAALETDGAGRFGFTLLERGKELGRVQLALLGKHNVYDALAAVALARYYGVSFSDIQQGLASFHGAARRMEYKGVVRGARVVLDYAHHPSEIRAVLEAVRHTAHNRLIAVFEPHTYTRLSALFPQFCECFAGCDTVLLADVYAAREKRLPGVNSKVLDAELKKRGVHAIYKGSYARIAEWLLKELRAGDLLLILGAGDIDKVWEMLGGDR